MPGLLPLTALSSKVWLAAAPTPTTKMWLPPALMESECLAAKYSGWFVVEIPVGCTPPWALWPEFVFGWPSVMNSVRSGAPWLAR